MSLDRIYNEYHELNKNPIFICGIKVGLLNENIYNDWIANMQGPKDSSYKGGLFRLSIHFSDNYPNEPPEVCFITPIYHLNINPKAPKFEGEEIDKLDHVSISTLN